MCCRCPLRLHYAEGSCKEENIRLEILAKIDMLKDTNGLHIEDSQG